MSKLYVLEGHDGAGKSSVIRELMKLTTYDNTVKFTKEPYANAYIELIRSTYDPFEKALLFAADRVLHIAGWSTLYNENDIVFMDRYVLSNLVYQSIELYEGGCFNNFETCVEYVHAIQPRLIYPEITFILECDPVEAHIRTKLKLRDTLGSHSESLDRLTKLKQTYHQLQGFYEEHYRSEVIFIDTTSKSISEVAKEILNYIKP